MDQVAQIFRSNLDGIAGRISTELAGISDPAIIKDRLANEHHRVLHACADCFERLAADHAPHSDGAETAAAPNTGPVGQRGSGAAPGSAEPGPFRSERAPYTIPVMRAFASPDVKRVVVVCGAQMGKTDCTLNILSWRLDDEPAPVMYIGPSKSFIENQLEPRLMAMFRSSTSLWTKLAKGKSLKKTMKLVSGTVIRLAWAGSATELSSMAAALALIDERDRMDNDVHGEGDVTELVTARGFTFPDFKLGIFSTPTRGNVNEEKDPTTG